MWEFIGLMVLTGALGALSIPTISILMGVTGAVEPFQVAAFGHRIEVRKWRIRHFNER
jgi:hypothetical protein